MNHVVYIVRCKDGTLYIGRTNDIQKRLRAHNGEIKGGAKYTRVRRPVELVYSEQTSDLSTALRREFQLKKLTREEKEAVIHAEKA
jgi:putative endonuclease